MLDHLHVIRQTHEAGFCNIVEKPYSPCHANFHGKPSSSSPRHLTHLWYGDDPKPVSFVAFSIDYARHVAVQEIGQVVQTNREADQWG